MPARAGHARRAIVFAGGDCSQADLALAASTPFDFHLCVDAGLLHCLAAGLVPHLLIGDLDSVPDELLVTPEVRGLPRLVYPSDKDASDLELALAHLAADRLDQTEQVVLLGMSGGRTDHMLFNWMLPLLLAGKLGNAPAANAMASPPFAIRFIDASVDAHVVSPDWSCRMEAGEHQTISLLALSPVSGLHATGLRYPLTAAELHPGSTLGLSNVSSGGPVTVTVNSGLLLVMAVRSEAQSD